MRKVFQQTSIPDPGLVVEGKLLPARGSQHVYGLSPTQRYLKWHARHTLLSWLMVALTLAMTLLILGYVYLWSTVTLFIVPATMTRESTIPITAAINPKDKTQNQVQILTASAASSEQVQPTGTFLIPAITARGTLTWYNQASYPQTIAASTILSVSPALHIVPDGEVTIPASTSSTLGETSAFAHIVEPGIAGNIPSGTLNQLCSCGSGGILVKNLSAFAGGQDVQAHIVIQASDIQQAISSQVDAVTQQARTNLQMLQRSPKLIAGKTSCSSKVTTDHPLGNEETHMQAMLTVTCSGAVTSRNDVGKKGIALFLSQVEPSLGNDQQLRRVQATSIHLTEDNNAQGPMQLEVHVWGEWTHRMSRAACQDLKRQLVGKTHWQAVQRLTQFPGIKNTSTIQQIIPWIALPSDPQRISIVPAQTCPEPPVE